MSAFHTQKVATNSKGQNKKRIMTIDLKQKSHSKSKNAKKIPKKLKIFILKIYKSAETFKKLQNDSK